MNRLRGLIFLSLLATTPTLVYFVAVAFFAPAGFCFFSALVETYRWVMEPSINHDGLDFVLLFFLNAMGYSAVFYPLSARIYRVVISFWPSRPARAVYVFVVLNTLLGFLPIYSGPSTKSAFELYRQEYLFFLNPAKFR